MATNKELLERNKQLREMLATVTNELMDSKRVIRELQSKLSGAEKKAQEFKITIMPYIDKTKVYEDMLLITRIIRQAIDNVDNSLLNTQTRLEHLLNNELHTEE